MAEPITRQDRASAPIGVVFVFLCALAPACQNKPLGGFCSITCGAVEATGARAQIRVALVTTLRDSVGDPLPGERVHLQVLRGPADVTQPTRSDDSGRAIGAAQLATTDTSAIQAWVTGPRGQRLECGSVQLSFAGGQGNAGLGCVQQP